MRRVLAGLALLLLLALAGVVGVVYWGWTRFQAPGPAATDVTLVIPSGAGVNAIGRQLHEAGVVDSPTVFALGTRFLGDGRPLKAGEYLFPARSSPRQAMELLMSGRTVLHKLTVAEGLTTAQIMALVGQAEALAGDLPAAGAAPGEGALLPETYLFSRGETRQALVGRMQAAMRKTLDALWATRAEGLPLRTPEEAVTLASIVEKETGLPAERPRVAAVFVNRLKDGMRLQSDPTVIYALTKGQGPLDRPLTRADLAVADPYNTYVNVGLPPGPIANPGRASLEAVLHPLQTKEIYFVADGTGGHVFAESLAEHNRNVAKWRKARAAEDAQPAR